MVLPVTRKKVMTEQMRFEVRHKCSDLPELRMASGSPFQTVGAVEEKRRAAVLERDLGIIGKSISADLSSRLCTYDSHVAFG